jgi:type I restriction enzyme S subunit
MSEIEIYVPPISEQVRIGIVLNQLENLYGDVKNCIPSEIKARRQQFEYYRNKLLTFKELDVA